MAERYWFHWAYGRAGTPGGPDLTGVEGVLRYLRTGGPRTDLDATELAWFQERKIPLVPIWQDGKEAASLGADRAACDWKRAELECSTLGLPLWVPVVYTVDNPYTVEEVRPYVEWLAENSVRPVGLYARFEIVEWAAAELALPLLIQTKAWSGTNPDGSPRTPVHAHLWHRDPNIPSGATKVDRDVFLASFPAWTGVPMADPTFQQRHDAYVREGLNVVVIPGAATNDRGPATGRSRGPKAGTTNHHTGGDTSDPYKYAASTLFKGRSDLPGPIAHDGMDPDTGIIYMVGDGRTNHAGGGDPNVLATIRANSLPRDREVKPVRGNADGVDGNGPLIGLEIMWSGLRPLSAVGYRALVKWNAANVRLLGRNGGSVHAHREWSDDKPDPGLGANRVDLPKLRRDTDAAVALPPGAWGGTTTQEDWMPLSEDDKAFFRSETERGAALIEANLGHLNGVQGNTGTGDLTHQVRVFINDGMVPVLVGAVQAALGAVASLVGGKPAAPKTVKVEKDYTAGYLREGHTPGQAAAPRSVETYSDNEPGRHNV